MELFKRLHDLRRSARCSCMVTPARRRIYAERWSAESERAEPVTETAAALGVSARTVYKWLDRYEREGEAGLLDRSSRPTCCPHATSAGVVRQIDKLRRRRLTAWQISRRLAVPRSTVSAWLKRLGLAKLDALEPKPEIVRYEYEHPGDLLHLDTRNWPVSGDLDTASTATAPSGPTASAGRTPTSLSTITLGWRTSKCCPPEDQHTCTAFLQRAVEHFASMGVAVRRVMTDNGPGYVSKRFNRLCHQLEIRHIYTRPYTPEPTAKPNASSAHSRSSGAYGTCYQTSARRTRALRPWLNHYNRHRPHAGIGMTPPIARLSGVSS